MRVIGILPIATASSLFKNFTALGHHWPLYDFLNAVQKFCPKLHYINFSGDVDLPVGLEDVDQSDYLHPIMELKWGDESQECMEVALSRFDAPQDRQGELFRAVCDVIFACPEVPALFKGEGIFDEPCITAFFRKAAVQFREVDRFKENNTEIITHSSSRESKEKIDFHHWWYANDKHYSRIWLRAVTGQKPMAAWIQKHIPTTMIFGDDFEWHGFETDGHGVFTDLTDKDRADRAAFHRKLKPYRDAVMPYLLQKGLSPDTLGAGYIFSTSENLYKNGVTNRMLNALLAIAIGECSSMAFTVSMMPHFGQCGGVMERAEVEAIQKMDTTYESVISSVFPWWKQFVGIRPSRTKAATLAFARSAFRSFAKRGVEKIARFNRAYELI